LIFSARDIKNIHVVENIPKPKEDVSKLAVTNNVSVKQSPTVEQQQSRPISATSYESSPAKPKWMPNWQSDGESKNGKSTPPRRAANGRHQQHRLSRNEDAFSAQVEDGEFDFEKNLALFDKQAVFEEIDSRKTWNNARVANDRQAVAKYKHDENVLPSEPVTMNQIKVNGNGNGSGLVKNSSLTAVSQLSGGISEFVTDTGLVVPTVTYDVRSRLLALAAEKGLTVERQIEAAGRSAAEVVVQLLGGGHR
jgi:enhancer of mRNA-decapping protein 3